MAVDVLLRHGAGRVPRVLQVQLLRHQTHPELRKLRRYRSHRRHELLVGWGTGGGRITLPATGPQGSALRTR